MERSAAILLALEQNKKFDNSLNVVKMVNLCTNTSEYESDGDLEDEIILNNLLSWTNTPIRSKNFVERVVNNYTRTEFQQNFRVQIEAYELLLAEVSRVYRERFPNYTSLPIDNQLLAVIWILANRESYRSVYDRFGMAKSTLSWCFFRIIKILNVLAPLFIKWPNEEEAGRIREVFYRQNKIKGIIGAVDGTYCPISAPFAKAHCYTNRKKFHSVTLQAICNDKMMFTDCFVGYPSSVHDARIFRNSPIFKKTNENLERFFSGDSKILGDKAYPCLKWCIPPYKDFERLTNVEKRFNRAHASTRQIIERCFALLFGRFRRLHHLEMKDVKNIPSTILAACVLHNVCIQFPEDIETTSEYVQNGIEDARRNSPEYRQSNRETTSEGRRERDKMAEELHAELG